MFFGVRRERRRLQRVINLLPEYVETLVAEQMGEHAMCEGLDGREIHGPAVRKRAKIEKRMAGIIGPQRKNKGAE